MKTLKQTTNYFTNGIFKNLQAKNEFEWLKDIGSKLDIIYYGHYSGNKKISEFYNDILKAETDGTIASAMDTICDSIIVMFKDKWDKINKSLNADYNPIENTDYTTEENIGTKVSSGTANKFKGFNSNTLKDTSSVDVVTEGKFDDNYRKVRTHGNIGNPSTQGQIEDELKVRKNNFYELIFNDVDSLLTLGFDY